MSVIIRLQNLPWSANALDIRNFFRGLSIPEGGVHIVGGEQGDAFIAFSTDEDARQAMMLDGGKIKEIQVKLLLSSRSEMHKVIEAARQSVPLLTLAAPVTTAPTPMPTIVQTQPTMPIITPFSAALSNNPLASFGIPGLGNPLEIPQPAVIEPPAPLISPSDNPLTIEEEKEDDEKLEKDKRKDRRKSRSRSRSRDRDRKDRKRDRRDRSRSRERRRRDRSRSRDRRDRKRDRKDRSRSRDRSPSRRSRDKRGKSPISVSNSQEKDSPSRDNPTMLPFGNPANMPMQMMQGNGPNGPTAADTINRFADPAMIETLNKMQELAKKRNPNAFQGEHNGSKTQNNNRNDSRNARGGGNFRRDGRSSRFDDQQRDCCVAIRNAPNHTSYGDVRRFFPFMIDKHGIKMINDNMGRRTGNIFVRFCETRSKQLALNRKNNELKGAMVVVEDLEDEMYEAAVDSYLPYREENDHEDTSLVIADHEEQMPPQQQEPGFTVLKLTDLPNFVKEHDIIKAFGDFSLLAIMLKDCRTTRTKIAHVQFAKREDAKAALERKDRYIFGRRVPMVTAVSDEEFEQEKNAQQPQPEREEVVPEPAMPRDPRQRRQFDGPPQQQQPLLQAPPVQQQPYFVPQFPQQQQQQPFPGGFGGPQFAGSYPSAGPMDPRANNNWAARPNFHNQMVGQGPGQMNNNAASAMEDAPLDCVLMKGLPRDATDRTIVNFLTDTGAVPARIHLMLDGNGLPSGDCFCEFRSTREARLAATKHGTHLEGCRVTVDLVPRTVVEEALEGPKHADPEPAPAPLHPHQQQQQQQPHFFDPSAMRGAFNGRGAYRGRGGFEPTRGGFEPTRGGYPPRGFDRGGYRGRGGFDRGRGDMRGRGRGRGGGPPRFGAEDGDPALEDFGAPGCVVSMENVPFRASIDEILQFFSEFELSQDDVIRRYNERGQPTGDARVAFRTPFDAQRAVKTRHMDTIHDRRISLCIL